MEVVERQKRMALGGLLVNVFILTVLVILAVLCDDGNSDYWKTGPSEDLKIVSVRINTSFKYACLLILVCMLNIGRVIVNDISNPTIFFPVYDPKSVTVEGWTRMELQISANILELTSGLRELFMV